jgi:hypothetical protein
MVKFKATPGEHVKVGNAASQATANRPLPDVRGSTPTVVTNVNVHGADPSQVKTQKHKNSTGGYDIEVMLADSVAKNIRGGGKIAQAHRDTFGATRSPIQR